MAASSATPPAHLVDSLKSACQSEPDARKRVDILLNLKDLNDSSEDELYYSRKLFDEAAAVGDGFAVGDERLATIVPRAAPSAPM